MRPAQQHECVPAARCATALVLAAGLVASAGAKEMSLPGDLMRLGETLCKAETFGALAIEAAAQAAGMAIDSIRTIRPGSRATAARAGGAQLVFTVRPLGAPGFRLRVRQQGAPGPDRRDVLLQLGQDCTVTLGRMVTYDAMGRAVTLLRFVRGPDRPPLSEPLNPPVPAGTDPGGVAVALFDTGINYTLPRFARALARGRSGEALGRDFADGDERPFDLDPSRPALFPVRHGTAVASIVLAEAPQARLIAYRYPGRDVARFAAMVDEIARTPARIVAMPLGGAKRSEWQPFAEAAKRHRDILFVVSAGNDGRDIDHQQLYPAGFDIPNMIVVTSSDPFGRIAPGSNWGAEQVDIAVPAERIDVIDHRGARGKASGSSYAVPRVAALAARLKAANPDWTAARIKSAILSLAAPLRGRAKPTRHGWIPNPAIE